MNKKTTTVLHSVVRELFEDTTQDPIPDVPAQDLQVPGALPDPDFHTASNPALPNMSPVYAQPQGLAMSPDHRTPDYSTPDYAAMRRVIDAHNSVNGMDPALGPVINASNSVTDAVNRVANRFQRDDMQSRIEAHNRTQPNGVDPAVGVYANIRAHNPKTGYDPALGPVINAANDIKDSVSNLASPQPWYQNGLNWMKNNKIATAGMIGVPAALAGAYMLNKRRNRNQQNG